MNSSDAESCIFSPLQGFAHAYKRTRLLATYLFDEIPAKHIKRAVYFQNFNQPNVNHTCSDTL